MTRQLMLGFLIIFSTVLMSCSKKSSNPADSATQPSENPPVSAPTVTISVNSGALYTNTATVSVSLNSSDSPTEMYITQDASCSTGGTWQSYSSPVNWNLTAINLANTIYAKIKTASSESACANATITHDNIIPTVSWSAPSDQDIMNLSQVTSLMLSGACSENGAVVNITGGTTSSATCSSGAWSTNVNLSSASDGTVNLTIGHTDAAGNTAVTATIGITKDSLPPTGNSLLINGGAILTGTTNVSLSPLSTGASQMYITNTAACSSGGAWETYSSGKSWTLPNSEAANTIYAKFRDLAGNETACVDATITHDSTIPVLTLTSPDALTFANVANVSSFTVSGACSANGQNVVISGALSGSTACTAGTWSISLNASGLGQGDFTLTANHSTAAMVAAPAISRTFTKDTNPPTANSIILNAAATHTNSSSVQLALASTGAAQMYITNTAGCASGGAWENYTTSKSNWTLGQLNATATVYVKYRDAAENETACVNDTIVHDNTAPTIAITSPAASSLINMFNVAAVTVSGTCSESGRTVTFSGSATGTATCTGGNTFSSNLNFNSAADGTVSVTVSITDLAANTTTASRSFNKDVTPPSNPSLLINAGNGYTTSTSATLTLAATDANDMYITEDPSCTAGSSYEAYATSKAWTLNPIDSVAYVYARFRDSNLNETACMTAMIVIDTTSPSWSDAPLHSSIFNSNDTAPEVFYLESAVDEDSGIAQYQYAIGTGTTGALVNNIKDWTPVTGGSFITTGLTLATSSTYRVHMKAIDLAGNEVQVMSVGWTVDSVAPALSFTSHTNNQFLTDFDQKITGSCESPYVVSLSYGANITGVASVPCTGNIFTSYVSFSGGTGTRTITASQTDLALNTHTVNLDFDFNVPVEIGGTVLAMTKLPDNSVVYGGVFNSISTTRQQGIVRLNSSGVLDTTLETGSGFNGQVLAVVELADGSIIAGGDFTTYRSRPAYRIAKISATGALDTTFNPLTGSNGFNSTVRALAVSGTDILVGGDFTSYRGAIANRIAKISSAGVLNTTFNPSPGANGANNRIRALAIEGSNLYIAGDFTTYRGGAALRVAKMDLSGSLDLTFNPSSGANGVSGIVRSLAADSSNLYIGGDFLYYRGTRANRIAKVSAAGDLDTTFNPASGQNGTNNYVYGIALNGSDVYISGQFTTYRGTSANRIAKITSSTGAINATFNPASSGTNNTVTSIASLSSDLYFGGTFSLYRGVSAVRIAKTNTAGVLDTTFSPATGANGFNNTVNAVFASGSNIYVGGNFSAYRAGNLAVNIAKISSTGVLDTTFSPQAGANGFNNAVRALASDANNVYVGGDFTAYRGALANRVAKLGLDGALDTTFNDPADNGVNGIVRALALSGTDLYVGGDFTIARGYTANRLVKLELLSGFLDLNFSPNPGANGTNNSVRALAVDGTDLYVGGLFTTYRGAVANRVAKLNATSGVLNTTFNPSSGGNGTNSYVHALAVNGTDLYIGGQFSQYRGTAANRIAKVTTAGVLDTTFNPTSGTNGTNSTVLAIGLSGSNLYLGGSFSTYRGKAVNNVCLVDTATGVYSSVFSPTSGGNGTSGAAPSVNALVLDGTSLYLGGAFNRYRGRAATNNVKVHATTGVQIP